MWFARRKYGWGWTPSTWQGWLVTFAYACGVLWSMNVTGIGTGDSDPRRFLLLLIPMTVALLLISWWKGETPRWQWRGKPI